VGILCRVRQVVRTTGALLLRRAVAVVPAAGLFAAAGLAEGLADVFRITAGAFFTGIGLWVGAVFDPPAQATAPIARVAAMVGSIMTGDQCTKMRRENTANRRLTCV